MFFQLKEELVNVYQQLKQLCKDCGHDIGNHDNNDTYKLGSLSPLLQDLRAIMQNMVSHKSHVSMFYG